MPLSEDEQRILDQIEEQFYESDPEFAREVGHTSLFRHAGRNMTWSIVGFVAGTVVLIAALSVSVPMAFAGFLTMLASAFWFERNARKMGRAGWHQVTSGLRGREVKQPLGDATKRLRDLFRRDKD